MNRAGESEVSDPSTNNNHIIIEEALGFEPDERGLSHLIFTCMKKHQDKVAQYLADTDEEDTYGELLKRSVRAALTLKKRNLDKDDVVVLCSYNQKNSAVPFLACTLLGIRVASLDPILSLWDITYLIAEVKPRIVFVVPETLQVLESALEETGLEVEVVVFDELGLVSDKHTSFSEFLQPSQDEDAFVPETIPSLGETAVIFFSSGTTGYPKGILTSHYALICQPINFINSGNLGDVSLSYTSLYWISNVLLIYAVIFSGTARVVCRRFDPEHFWRLIDKYKVTNMFLAPSQVVDVVKAGRPDGVDTTSLLSCMIGGATISRKLTGELRDLLPGTFVAMAYGQTEVTGVIAFFRINQVKDTLALHHRPESVGRIAPGFKYKVVNLETEEACGANESGELRLKTPMIMNGYFGRDSSESFDAEGWLKTGDVVYYDEDGFFYVVDRIKEMLKYRSWHVAPAMVEKIVLEHPAVQRVVVVGLPHEEDGDHPMAVVVLNQESVDAVTETDIEKFVAERAPDRMRLRGGLSHYITAHSSLGNRCSDSSAGMSYVIENNIIKTEAIDFDFSKSGGLGNLLFNWMKKHGGNVAQVDPHSNRKDTFEHLLRLCVRTALTMRSKGIKRGDMVMGCSDIHMDAWVPAVAALFLGAVPCFMDPTLIVSEMKQLLDQVRPKIIFSVPSPLNRIKEACLDLKLDPEIVVFGNSEKYAEFETFLQRQTAEDQFVPYFSRDTNETAMVYFSSGSSGLPKACCLSHTHFIWQANLVPEHVPEELLDVERRDFESSVFQRHSGGIILSYASPFWISAAKIFIKTIVIGFPVLFCKKFDPDAFWNLVDKHKVTMCLLPPLAMSQLAKRSIPPNTTSLVKIMTGGAAMERSHWKPLQDALPDVDIIQLYGLTETGVITSFKTYNKKHREYYRTHPECVGFPDKGIWYKVVDLETEENLGPNREGELCVKSDILFMNGFLNQSADDVYDADGWYKTGDLAYYTEDCALYVTDRLKELIRYRRMNIYPSVIESELLRHPAVADAVVVGVPYEEDGERPAAFVILNKGFNETAKELREFADERAQDKYKLRGGLWIVESFPTTSTGKVKRVELRRMIMEGNV
ncbi:hypothetical protein NQ315_006248 [Exocentrus adspersus]|uniref:Luciferin 4-monooxygenase n=1 Tax=Exocentrus adspersus TaxID=1586481 RepID=A0AAV8VZM1_9CUCU|nr:hypothetical protein NQ315_006248 [Exocentrus adspersus]